MNEPTPEGHGEGSQSLECLASKCRRLADAIADGPTRESLLKLAEDYERQSSQTGTLKFGGSQPSE